MWQVDDPSVEFWYSLRGSFEAVPKMLGRHTFDDARKKRLGAREGVYRDLENRLTGAECGKRGIVNTVFTGSATLGSCSLGYNAFATRRETFMGAAWSTADEGCME